MDLVFLFWSISIGIICGAGLYAIAFISSIVLTIGIVILEMLPVSRAPMILVINSNDVKSKEAVIKTIKENTKSYQIKSQSVKDGRFDIIVELRTKNSDELLDSISSIEEVEKCSIISHNGEVTF
jgi:uncharacterized membrane protein YhiD involved in acid resistance